MRVTSNVGFFLAAAVVLCGCDEDPKKKPKEEGWAHSTALASGETTASSAPPIDTSKIIERPRSASDLALTSPRRARVEKLLPEGQGFIPMEDIETKLFALELKRGDEKRAIEAFDEHAKGKWVLFTGNIANPTKDGFELVVHYTPRDPNDPVGLTSNWFAVRFSGIEGYDTKAYRAGEPTAILGKYSGSGEVKEGFDTVLLGHWMKRSD